MRKDKFIYVFLVLLLLFVSPIGLYSNVSPESRSASKATTESNILDVYEAKMEEKKIDSVYVESYRKLNDYSDKFLIKLGTIYMDTEASLAENLFEQKEAIHISNPDRTIDVFRDTSFTTELQAEVFLSKFWIEGLIEAMPVKLKIKEGQISYESSNKYNVKYALTLGAYDGTVPLPQFMKLLSVQNLKCVFDTKVKKYVYVYGVYYSQKAVEKAMVEVRNLGLYADVLRYGKGLLFDMQPSDLYDIEERNHFVENKLSPKPVTVSKVVCLVQLGVFKGETVDRKMGEMPIVVFPFNGGMNKVFSGSFDNYKDAYKHKLMLKDLGFEGVFNVAHRGGGTLDYQRVGFF